MEKVTLSLRRSYVSFLLGFPDPLGFRFTFLNALDLFGLSSCTHGRCQGKEHEMPHLLLNASRVCEEVEERTERKCQQQQVATSLL